MFFELGQNHRKKSHMICQAHIPRNSHWTCSTHFKNIRTYYLDRFPPAKNYSRKYHRHFLPITICWSRKRFCNLRATKIWGNQLRKRFDPSHSTEYLFVLPAAWDLTEVSNLLLVFSTPGCRSCCCHCSAPALTLPSYAGWAVRKGWHGSSHVPKPLEVDGLRFKGFF